LDYPYNGWISSRDKLASNKFYILRKLEIRTVFKNLPLQTRMLCSHLYSIYSVAPRDSASTFEAGQPVQVSWRQIGFSSSTSLTINFKAKGTIYDSVELSTAVATYVF
jgi:hypothetical protein